MGKRKPGRYKKEMSRDYSRGKPACPACRHRGYQQTVNPHTKRPQFTCDFCRNTWCAGITGLPWNKDPELRNHPRMDDPLQMHKLLGTPEDWCPCYEPGKVRASILELLTDPPRYRVQVWGGGDTGMELNFDNLHSAEMVYRRLPDPVTRADLKKLGFGPG